MSKAADMFHNNLDFIVLGLVIIACAFWFWITTR